MYKAAFARHHGKDASSPLAQAHSFQVMAIARNGGLTYVSDKWIPPHVIRKEDSNLSVTAILRNFLEHSGPVTKYEVMERYGLSSESAQIYLQSLEEEGLVSQGSFVGAKDSPQWCWKKNLEELHRRSLRSLREQVKPLTPDRYADFMVKWQHIHPDTRLKGKYGAYKAIKQLQGWEEHITCWERYFLSSRVSDYNPEYLDELIRDERVSFGRFSPLPDHVLYTLPRRGVIQLYCKEDSTFVVNARIEEEYYEDVREECEDIIDVLKIWPSLSFEGIVTGTLRDRNRLARALLQLFQLGVLENDSYDVVRESIVISGMSAAWDLTHTPEEVSSDVIYKNIQSKRIRVNKGKWALVERPRSDPSENTLLDQVRQIFVRYGIITRDILKVNREIVTPQEFFQAARILLLRGEIREGRFIEGVEGIQYALPEAVEFLREMEPDTTFVVMAVRDPANLYGKLFPITDADGNTIKHTMTVGKHIVLQGGVSKAIVTSKNYPGRYFNIEMSILYNLTKEETVVLLEKVIEYAKYSAVQKRFKAVRFVSFNEQPPEDSGVDRILEAFGFSRERNGYILPMKKALKGCDVATLEVPDIFEKLKVSEPEIVAV